MNEERKAPHWEAIELQFRTGVLTLREIAKQYGITEGAIRKRAKRDSWERDLAARVQEKVRTELVRNSVRAENPARQETEKEIVAQAAATIVQIVREHRRDIKRGRSLYDILFGQLTDAIGAREAIEGLIHEETAVADDAPGYERAAAASRRAAMLKAVSLRQHITSLKDLSLVLKNLIPLEPEAFNVAGEEPDGPTLNVVMPALPGYDALGAKLRGYTKVPA